MNIAAVSGNPVPQAMPTASVANRNATSRGSLIAVRKRMIESAPTRLKARAMLLPMISMISVTVIVISTSVWTNDVEYEIPRCVRR